MNEPCTGEPETTRGYDLNNGLSPRVISGDSTPEYQLVRCSVNGWDDSGGSWSIDALAKNELLRFTSSKRSSAKAVAEVKAILQETNGFQHPKRLIGLRKGVLILSRDHFDDLVCAFMEFEQTIERATNEGTSYPLVEELEAVYRKYFLGVLFRFGKAKQRPRFDTNTYPSLFSELPLLDKGQGLPIKDLPIEWTPAALTAKPQIHDPLVAMLLGFIWKQGDFPKVANLLKGLRNTAQQCDDSVVLYQFGKHLANPMAEPIFDQHSCRAQWLLTEGISNWESPDDLRKHLPGDQYAKVLFGDFRGQLGQQHLKNYLDWWTQLIVPVLPTTHSERISALQCIDRLMFCLGKAAVFLLRPVLSDADE